MRSIVNISLPKNMVRIVEKEVKSGRFSTKSEFFRNLIRVWEEKKLFSELKESQKEIKNGSGKVLRSLKNLR